MFRVALTTGTPRPMPRRYVPALLAPLALAAACTGSSGSSQTTTATRTVVRVASAPTGGAPAVQSTFTTVISRIAPSVVQIRSAGGLGSGIVFDANGDIVTNAHV